MIPSLWGSFQRGYFENTPNTIVYLTFTLTLVTSNLIIPPYSEYQQFLYETISDLRDRGLNFKQIADWLNENGYSTPRSKKFRVVSINLTFWFIVSLRLRKSEALSLIHI